jgi:CHAT domain-containing protein/tetratricopeptide (TPR) repeat protein
VLACLFSVGCSFTSLDRAARLHDEATLLHVHGRFAEALALEREALALRERALGSENVKVGQSLNAIGTIEYELGNYVEARATLQRAQKVWERTLPANDSNVALILHNVAVAQDATGDYGSALALEERALRIREQTLGPASPEVAQSLMNSAAMLQRMGDYGEAWRRYERALAIRERRFGPIHPEVADSLNWLGTLMWRTGDYAAARALFERALAIRRQTLDPNHPSIAQSLNNLGTLSNSMGDYAAGAKFHEQAMLLWQQRLGSTNQWVGAVMTSLAVNSIRRGDYASARGYAEKGLQILEGRLGPVNPLVADSAMTLGAILDQTGDAASAELLFERALRIAESTMGENHADTATVLGSLASHYSRSGNYTGARVLYERERRILLVVGRRNEVLADESLAGLFKHRGVSLEGYLDVLAAIGRDPSKDSLPPTAVADAFMVVDQIHDSAAQRALVRAATLVAARDAAAANVAREVQELRERQQTTLAGLTREYGRPPADRAAGALERLQADVERIGRQLAESEARLARVFPGYSEFATPEPITIPAVQQLIHADEALVVYAARPDRLLIWLIRATTTLYKEVGVTREELVGAVTRVRESADQGRNPGLPLGRLTPFDVAGAHRLYSLLIEPVAEGMLGVKHLMLVPDDVLLPVPLGALVVRGEGDAYQRLKEEYDRNRSPGPSELALYPRVAWLAKEYAVSVLPSAGSLRALRLIGRRPVDETEPFIGVGDPILRGNGGGRGGAMVVGSGAMAPLDEIRGLAQLPATREELMTIARTLGADPARALYVGDRATKPQVAGLNASGRLGRARVVSFATHGLVGGEVRGLRQPALVLTPPLVASAEDDGLLTLDDIAGFRLRRTDWVVLSACNTAAPDGSGEGLSGLVRAFFFAGAPTLLVSHWAVEDQSTRWLMGTVFRHYADDPHGDRAEAVRSAMVAMMNAAGGMTAYFAHPFAWAAFFLVGESIEGVR